MSIHSPRRRSFLPMATMPALLLVACGASAVRFVNGPVVTTVDDTSDIPLPKEHEFYRFAHHSENFVSRQLRLRLDPVLPRPAADVNRLGEVPNSTWYENRPGKLRPEDVARGVGHDDPGPEPHVPWTVISWKSGGQNPGFVFEDSRGVRYICKFDKPGEPLVATGAGVVANRLFWACGYNVPDDRIAFFDRSELHLSEQLVEATENGDEEAVTDALIDASLEAYVARMPSGKYRVLVSRFLDGRPVGGFHYRGTRDDDPNDTIPHQNRRSLRALRLFGAWLNHVDLKVDNTLDLYVERNGRHFLQHYLVDFDGCLGGYWAARHEERIGYAYDIDLGEFASGLFALGMNRRPYESLGDVPHAYLGLIEADTYDPAIWKANYLNDFLLAMSPADAYWAANILAQIDRKMIAAAVSAARFGDDRADHILTSILYRRWAKTVDWGLSRVTPVMGIDRTRVADGDLIIEAQDALLHHGRPSSLRYEVRLLDREGKSVWDAPEGSGPATTIPESTLSGHDYVIVRWTAIDSKGEELPPSEGHYVKTTDGWKLLGILRDGQ